MTDLTRCSCSTPRIGTPVRRYGRATAADRRRRGLQLAIGWLVSLLLTGWIVGEMVTPSTAAAAEKRQRVALITQSENLRQQVANLQRSQQVEDLAAKALRGMLSEREKEITDLRTDLSFYSRLMGGDIPREGFAVRDVRLRSVANSQAWNLTFSLTHSTQRGEAITGKAVVGVEGLLGDKVVLLDWPALGDATQKDGISFGFKYFQHRQVTIALPADFRPLRLQIHLQPTGENAILRTVAWSDALAGKIATTSGDHDVQP